MRGISRSPSKIASFTKKARKTSLHPLRVMLYSDILHCPIRHERQGICAVFRLFTLRLCRRISQCNLLDHRRDTRRHSILIPEQLGYYSKSVDFFSEIAYNDHARSRVAILGGRALQRIAPTITAVLFFCYRQSIIITPFISVYIETALTDVNTSCLAPAAARALLHSHIHLVQERSC